MTWGCWTAKPISRGSVACACIRKGECCRTRHGACRETELAVNSSSAHVRERGMGQQETPNCLDSFFTVPSSKGCRFFPGASQFCLAFFDILRLNSALDFPRSEFSECSKICRAFFGRVCGRKRKDEATRTEKKEEKKSPCGESRGLDVT